MRGIKSQDMWQSRTYYELKRLGPIVYREWGSRWKTGRALYLYASKNRYSRDRIMSDSWNIGAPTYCNSVPIRDCANVPVTEDDENLYTGSIAPLRLSARRKNLSSRRVDRHVFSLKRNESDSHFWDCFALGSPPDTSCNTLRVSPWRGATRGKLKSSLSCRRARRRKSLPREVTRLRWYVSGPQYSGGDSTK